MESTLVAEFDTRRAAELAVEQVVQECGVSRGGVFVQPTGGDNSSGNRPACADAKAAPKPEQGGKFEGAIEFHGEDAKQIEDGLKSASAKSVRTK